jgi:hypothetical protein
MNMLIILLIRLRIKLRRNTTTNKINPLRHLLPRKRTTSIKITSPPILQLLGINVILLHGVNPLAIKEIKYIPITPRIQGERTCHKWQNFIYAAA